MNNITDQFVENGLDTIPKKLDRLVAKDKLSTAQKREIMGWIKKSTNFENIKDADFVVEAGVERDDLKLNIFRKLDEVSKPLVSAS
jgi:3-hydroxybutyryl-CoA dehydrogenase